MLPTIIKRSAVCDTVRLEGLDSTDAERSHALAHFYTTTGCDETAVCRGGRADPRQGSARPGQAGAAALQRPRLSKNPGPSGCESP